MQLSIFCAAQYFCYPSTFNRLFYHCVWPKCQLLFSVSPASTHAQPSLWAMHTLQLQPFLIVHIKTKKGFWGGQFLWVMWMAKEGGRNDTSVNAVTQRQLKIWPLVSAWVLCLFTILLMVVEPGTTVGCA